MIHPRVVIVIGLGIALCACSAPWPASRQRASTRPLAAAKSAAISNTDPCAARLHDLSGGLLLYYASHHTLPPTIDAIEQSVGVGADQLVCPVSQQRYIYQPQGLPAPEPGARIVLYDATPAHAGLRWAVTIIEPADGGPLITKVIAVPEARFAEKKL